MIYINAIDGLFALAFWGIFFPVKWLRQKWSLPKWGASCLVQGAVIGLVLAPALVLGHVDASLNASVVPLGTYYLLAYLGMPLFLITILFVVQRIDPYELFYNFRHVYIIMLTEIVLVTVSSLGIFPLDLHITQNRIVQFFAHIYYYLPVIYFASRPVISHAFGFESRWIARCLRHGLHAFFARLSHVYLPVAIVLLLIYNASSGIRNFETNQHIKNQTMEQTQ